VNGRTSARSRRLFQSQGGVIKKYWIRIPAIQSLLKTSLQDPQERWTSD
jgi:hypothetical protein